MAQGLAPWTLGTGDPIRPRKARCLEMGGKQVAANDQESW